MPGDAADEVVRNELEAWVCVLLVEVVALSRSPASARELVAVSLELGTLELDGGFAVVAAVRVEVVCCGCCCWLDEGAWAGG